MREGRERPPDRQQQDSQPPDGEPPDGQPPDGGGLAGGCGVWWLAVAAVVLFASSVAVIAVFVSRDRAAVTVPDETGSQHSVDAVSGVLWPDEPPPKFDEVIVAEGPARLGVRSGSVVVWVCRRGDCVEPGRVVLRTVEVGGTTHEVSYLPAGGVTLRVEDVQFWSSVGFVGNRPEWADQ